MSTFSDSGKKSVEDSPPTPVLPPPVEIKQEPVEEPLSLKLDPDVESDIKDIKMKCKAAPHLDIDEIKVEKPEPLAEPIKEEIKEEPTEEGDLESPHSPSPSPPPPMSTRKSATNHHQYHHKLPESEEKREMVYPDNNNLDKNKKLSREERKIEAYMKAFERMERQQQRKQEHQAKQAHRRESDPAPITKDEDKEPRMKRRR